MRENENLPFRVVGKIMRMYVKSLEPNQCSISGRHYY